MKTRPANRVQTRLVTLLYGATFSGKTTMGLQLAYFKRNDGKPFRLAVVDAEGGGVDDAIGDLEDAGVDMRNVHIFYTQSLKELTTILDKIKGHETFYEYDADGNETDVPMLDADGEPFRPDALLIDGTSIFRMTSEQGLLELSKKRNTVKADKDGLVGAERFVKIQGSDLEYKDYKKLNYSGQNLVLDLMAIGINVVLTAREKDETTQRMDRNGQQVSVSTGRKVHDSFKGIDYNVKTILHMFQDPDTSQICAEVVKDRTKVHKPGEILEDPTLLDWQAVIDRNAGREDFVLGNDLDRAVEAEQEMYEREAMGPISPGRREQPAQAQDAPRQDADSLRREIAARRDALPPADKRKMRERLEAAGLPTSFKDVTDTEILRRVLDAFG